MRNCHFSLFAGGGDSGNLNEMTANSYAKTDSGFLCLLCGSLLSNLKCFRTHFRDTHFATTERYSCPVCRRIYKNKNSFGNHMSIYHKELRGLDIRKCLLPSSPSHD